MGTRTWATMWMSGLLLLTSGCGSASPRDDSLFGDGDGSATGGTVGHGGAEAGELTTGVSASAEGGGNEGADSAGGDESGSIKFDAGTPLDAGLSGDGCENVDLLFIIDESVSMQDEQDNLAASFPLFISAIQEALPQVDRYHVAVNSATRYDPNPANCQMWGALVTQTPAGQCGPYAEGSYMTGSDDLETAFACAAAVGTDGFDERPMQSLVAIMDGSLAGPGGCNEGFLRDDALLVVVIITDEEDDWEYYDPGDAEKWQGSDGNPPDWYQAVVDAKGIESNAVVLAVVGGVPGNVCVPFDNLNGAEDAVRIREFASMFTNNVIADVCAPDYGAEFMQAISIIETACNDFEPPG